MKAAIGMLPDLALLSLLHIGQGCLVESGKRHDVVLDAFIEFSVLHDILRWTALHDTTREHGGPHSGPCHRGSDEGWPAVPQEQVLNNRNRKACCCASAAC